MRCYRFVSAFLSLCFAIEGANAHDFWLELDTWQVDGDATEVNVQFLVGHAGDRDDWAINPERVVALTTAGPSGALDRRRSIFLPNAREPGGAVLQLDGEGTHVIAFETNNASYSDLPAEKFNAYVDEEGLAAAAVVRRDKGLQDRRGRERYSRRAKAIVQVGRLTNEGLAVGHTLEIIPRKNPFTLAEGEPLAVEVRYKGVPLAGALVNIESLDAGLIPEIKKLTDEHGVASFDFPKRGAWKFNVVWTEVIDEDPKADFETVFSSLTFGYNRVH